MKTAVTVEIDTDNLHAYTDQYLATLWHVAQANPAPITDHESGQLAEAIGREIIRRFISTTPPPLWDHQGMHGPWCELVELRSPEENALDRVVAK